MGKNASTGIKSFGNITMEGKAEAPPTEANDQFSQSFIENGTGFTCNYDIGKGYLFDNTTVALVSFSCNGKETKIAWYPVVK